MATESMLDESAAAQPPPRPLAQRERAPFRLATPVDIRSVSLSIIAGAAVLAILQLALSVIIPFVVSGLLFYALDPIVDTLQRWRLPRSLGAALVLLVTIGGIGAGAYAISDARCRW